MEAGATGGGHNPPIRRITTTQVTLAFCALLVVGAWAVLFVVTRLDYGREVDRARSENAFTAVAFEEHARRIIKTADFALLHLKEEYEAHGAVTERVRSIVRMTKADLQTVHVMIVDADGNLQYSAMPVEPPVNIRDRECFRVHLRREVPGLFIGKPVQVMGKWTFFMSRRLERRDGSFAGIVSIGIDPFFFGKTYGRNIFSPGRSALIAGLDHVVRVRISPTENLVGDDISGYSPVFKEAERRPVGSYEVKTIRDGTERMASYRVMPDYPLVVIGSAAKADVLADYSTRRLGSTLATLLFTALDAGFCFFLVRTHRLNRRREEETRSLEEQLAQSQKMEAIGRLAGGVAHDFNNMLGVILGRTDLALAQVDPSGPLYRNLEEIGKAAQRSANVTRQLLAFARKQAAAPKVLDLNENVSTVLKMIRSLIGEHIELSWTAGPDLWRVRIDPAQLDQVLTNLVVNARDAVGTGGRIAIGTDNFRADGAFCAEHPGFVPGEYVVLSVSDNGHGIERETLATIFEPFFTTKERGKGTGLGLATVYGIARQNGGFITVDSDPGEGATFRLFLPKVAGEGGGVPAEHPVPSEPRGGAETILVVEDEAANLRLLKDILESFGYRVIAAGNPAEAIRAVESNRARIDLLVTDVVMPLMNGRELCDMLSGILPGLKCLFISGYTADVIAHSGVLEDGVNFLQKPFPSRALAEKVREILDGGGGDRRRPVTTRKESLSS